MYFSVPFYHNYCPAPLDCLTTNNKESAEGGYTLLLLHQYLCCFLKESKEAKREKKDYKTQIADKKENTVFLPNPSTLIKIILLPPKAAVMQV
jgi:hypothetical protein